MPHPIKVSNGAITNDNEAKSLTKLTALVVEFAISFIVFGKIHKKLHNFF